MWKQITWLLLMALLALPLAATGKLSELLSRNPIWLQTPIQWERAPRDVNPKSSAAFAVAVYFRDDGKFGMISGTFYRQDGKITASAGDSESVCHGKWTLQGEKIHVTYQLVYRDLKIEGQSLPGPLNEMDFWWDEKKKELKVSGAKDGRLHSERFAVNPALSNAGVEAQILLDRQWD